MNDRIKADNLLADLAAFIAVKHNLSAREATGIVMQSNFADNILHSYSTYMDMTMEELVQEL